MKKIFFSIVALAALAACTKSEVAYEQPSEIGFKAVAGNLTKAIVPNGEAFPTGINLYVFAETDDNAGADANGNLAPNYINNGEFAYISSYADYTTDEGDTDATIVWGAADRNNPYYWPNVKRLHFAGYSKSGNFRSDNKPSVNYNCDGDVLTITGYTPGNATGKGENDLMWFGSTKYVVASKDGYLGKETDYVSVSLAHTCSWITFIVKGDKVTSGNYTVKSINIAAIDATANVTCSSTATTPIVWDEETTNDKTSSFAVDFKSPVLLNESGTNPETGNAETTTGNIVVIPQTPGSLELTYSYNSTTGAEITEVYSVAKNNALSLAIDTDPDKNVWEPGKHYIYTITIKANEILIAPTPLDWTNGTGGDITVE